MVIIAALPVQLVSGLGSRPTCPPCVRACCSASLLQLSSPPACWLLPALAHRRPAPAASPAPSLQTVLDFSLSDQVFARARVADVTSVNLWLGADVMLQYPLGEAQVRAGAAPRSQAACQGGCHAPCWAATERGTPRAIRALRCVAAQQGGYGQRRAQLAAAPEPLGLNDLVV